jgi:hypothetical protein
MISVQIQKQQPFFQAYKDGWPIRSMMQTYMANSKQSAKKRRQALGCDENKEEDESQSEDEGSNGREGDEVCVHVTCTSSNGRSLIIS